MKMQFKLNAIIRFALSSNASLSVTGRVISVASDEIVIVPQRFIAKNDYEPSLGTKRLDTTISVDENREIHLDRSLVAMWSYAKVPKEDEYVTYFDVWQPSDIEKMHISVNNYDDDGCCKGNGDYFE